MKLCKLCNLEKPENECMEGRFRCIDCHVKVERERYHRGKEKHKEKRLEYGQKNKKIINEKAKAWYDQNGERARERISKYYYSDKDNINMGRVCKKYNLTKEEYVEMVEKCNNTCEICLKPIKKGCVDHCHKTGDVRGYICGNCNSAIGFLKDDHNIVKRAANYLLKHQINIEDSDGACAYFFGLQNRGVGV